MDALEDDLEEGIDESNIILDILEKYPSYTTSKDDIYGLLYTVVFGTEAPPCLRIC